MGTCIVKIVEEERERDESWMLRESKVRQNTIPDVFEGLGFVSNPFHSFTFHHYILDPLSLSFLSLSLLSFLSLSPFFFSLSLFSHHSFPLSSFLLTSWFIWSLVNIGYVWQWNQFKKLQYVVCVPKYYSFPPSLPLMMVCLFLLFVFFSFGLSNCFYLSLLVSLSLFWNQSNKLWRGGNLEGGEDNRVSRNLSWIGDSMSGDMS